MQPTLSQVKAQIFVAVASALANKWPSRDKNDYETIANATKNLTEKLFEKYIEDSKNND